jgi:Flp pilus assembly pilin Flp
MDTLHRYKREKGQGLVEYGLILILVAVVVLIVVAVLGPSIGSMFSNILAKLPGGAEPNWTYCATEHQVCAFSGTKTIRYGENGTYVTRSLTNGTPCENVVFGDPLVGVLKHCDIQQ